MSRHEGIQMIVGLVLATAGTFLAFGAGWALLVAGTFLVVDVQMGVARRNRGRRAG